jgi:hypothetical protein
MDELLQAEQVASTAWTEANKRAREAWDTWRNSSLETRYAAARHAQHLDSVARRMFRLWAKAAGKVLDRGTV